jgi:Lon protease-like protein
MPHQSLAAAERRMRMRRRELIRMLSGAGFMATAAGPWLPGLLRAQTASPLLALFPLNVVLLPGNTLPLHIFEPRYREMIQECIDGGLEFGVLRATGDGIAPVGCTAHVTDVIHRYRDGSFDVLTRGERRFRIGAAGPPAGTPEPSLLSEGDFNSERTFFRGAPSYIDDDRPASGEQGRDDALIAQALELRNRLNMLIAQDDAQSALPRQQLPAAGHPQLSFHLMDGLPADADWKQALLELRVERERLVRVVLHLQRLIQYMEDDPANPTPHPVA